PEVIDIREFNGFEYHPPLLRDGLLVYHQLQLVFLRHDVAEPEPQPLLLHIFEQIERVAAPDKEYRLGIVRFATRRMYLDFQTDDDIVFIAWNVLHRRITVDAFHYDISVTVPYSIPDIGLV